MPRLADDLLAEAAACLGRVPRRGRPKQVVLRRAVSTAYYALFHAICAMAADNLVGRDRGKRPHRAWVQTYRSLNHGEAERRFNRLVEAQTGRSLHGFPQQAGDVAIAFTTLQEERHRADYDPEAAFTWREAFDLWLRSRQAMAALAELRNPDAKALAVWLLLDPPRKQRNPPMDARAARR
jgi:hypothetical protein